jgi:hypothetical protein
MPDGSDRSSRRWLRVLDSWVDHSTVLDSWVDPRWQRRITLYALADPLRDQGYVAVGQSANGAPPRMVVLLREGDELRTLLTGDELPSLRRRARAVAGRTLAGRP